LSSWCVVLGFLLPLAHESFSRLCVFVLRALDLCAGPEATIFSHRRCFLPLASPPVSSVASKLFSVLLSVRPAASCFFLFTATPPVSSPLDLERVLVSGCSSSLGFCTGQLFLAWNPSGARPESISRCQIFIFRLSTRCCVSSSCISAVCVLFFDLVQRIR
jgi:hypothetical protein